LFVSEKNAEAVNFYEKTGFVTERRYLKRYYRGVYMVLLVNIDDNEKWDNTVKGFEILMFIICQDM